MLGPGSGPQYTPATDKQGRVSRYRVELPRAGIVETETGHFEATEFAERRTGWTGRLLDARDRLIGNSMSSARLTEERLSKRIALPVFASDALSSTAYATQEMLIILAIAGSGAIRYSLPIALCIVALLAVVVTSYSQLIRAYPSGGGAYTVAADTLGRRVAVLAASALLIDYTLTVSVSLSACVAAIGSAAPEVNDYRVPLAVFFVALIAFGNLRGMRESGTLFAIPTYGFIVILGGTIVAGIVQTALSDEPNLLATGEPQREVEKTAGIVMWFLLLRAFSTGATALTGVEAISNGVMAFKPPEARNARTTLIIMGVILAFLFLGTTLLARHYGIVHEEQDQETVLSLIGKEVFGTNIFYYLLQGFTAGILFLAANTAFNGFPMLGAILARDGFMPRIFHQRGNRLVYSYGIAALAGFSALLIIGFGASTTRLIPLYAFGVFLCFTIAQTGLFRRWRRLRPLGWQRKMVLSGAGALITATVTVIIVVTKFREGGWMVLVLIPVLTFWLWRIGGFYRALRRTLYVAPEAQLDLQARGESRVSILVPVEDINLATVMTLGAACERSREVTAIHVRVDPGDSSDFEQRWRQQFPAIPLVVIDSPFRTVADPIARYIDDALKRPPHELTVMVPLLEVRRWWHRPLVNQSLKRLASLLKARRHVTVVSYPFYAGGTAGRRRRIKKGMYMGNG